MRLVDLPVLLCLSGLTWGCAHSAETGRSSNPKDSEAGSSHETRRSPVVMKLVEIVNSNPQIRADVETILQRRFSIGSAVDLDQMYRAIDTIFQPGGEAFHDLLSVRFLINPLLRTPEGRRVLASKEIQAWFREFLRARKEYMDSAQSGHLVPILANASLDGPVDFVVPEGGFASLNSFFTRKLRPGARPIAGAADETIVVAPVDGSAQLHARRAGDKLMTIKDGVALNVEQMLTDSEHAARFKNGSVLGFFLNVNNYHHFHAPVSGKIIERRDAVGNYFSIWLSPGFLVEQYRGHYIIETESHGLVALVAFGMSVVESVNLTAQVNDVVKKGDDLGYFAYGGSYVAVVFEHEIQPIDPLTLNHSADLTTGGTDVRLGSRVASLR
jgi:phosphatidylserine decarboxylase precursor